MACNSCTKEFSLLRKEKGCPSCGFSFCSQCLNNKIFVPKLNTEAKVCGKCKNVATKPSEPSKVEAPDAYYRRIGAMEGIQAVYTNANDISTDSVDKQIAERLHKLKKDKIRTGQATTEEDIRKRLHNIKGETPSTSDAELYSRLAKLKGVSIELVTPRKPVLPPPDTRTEEEQTNDLLKQYMEQTNIDTKYNDEFESLISNMEARMSKLKGTNPTPQSTSEIKANSESEDEEETIKKIVEKIKVETTLENDEISPSTNDELPFCEICNEDAVLRCLGCRYLFCKRCYVDHKDDDDGCNRYEPYQPPKNT